MKLFDLEKAKAGAPLVTRDGRKARFIAHVPEAGHMFRVVAIIDNDESTLSFGEDGKFREGGIIHDLFMAMQKRTVYVNVYDNRLNTSRNFGNHAAAFDDEEGARNNAKGNGVRVIAVAVAVEIEV